MGSSRLYFRFLRTYVWPHRRTVGLCMLLAGLNACSCYLLAYYGRLVVDDILMVASPGTYGNQPVAGSESVTSENRSLKSAGLPLRGALAETGRSVKASPREAGAMGRLIKLFGIYVLTVSGLNLMARIANRLRIGVSRDMTVRLREDIHGKILSLSRSFHLSQTPGRLLSRILSDVNVVQGQMMSSLIDASAYACMGVCGLALLIVLDWRMALLTVVAAVPYAEVIRRFRRDIQPINREIWHTNSCLWGLVSQKLDSVRAIFAYGREKQERLNFHRLSAWLLRDTLGQQQLGARVSTLTQIITGLTTAAIFLACTRRVLAGSMSLGHMMFIYGTAANLFTPVLGLTQMSVVLANLRVVLQRLDHVFDQTPEIRDCPGAVDFPVPLQSGIDLRNVTFAYSPDRDPVLRNVSLPIPSGKWVCLMGPSGAGKTTLLQLIARLYEPTSGEINVGGLSLNAIRLDSLRRHIALVPQEPQILSGTVRDNITYGDPGASPGQIMAAARAAECHDFIMSLPVKYETTVGEKGVTLSGGQRQRLSIARALLTNPEVLLLDDCTSALDAETEWRIQDTLVRLLSGKTAVMVSQRVSMARRCHHISVLEDGAITEQGTHESLAAGNGFYAALCARQLETGV